MVTTSAWIEAVRSTHDHFAAVLRPLSEDAVRGRSYATDWSIADTASHLGSQAEIFDLFLDAGLVGGPAPGGDVFGGIWDRWNALPPTEQVAQSVATDEAFVTRVEQTPDEQRERFSLTAFGSEQDLAGLLATRLGELAVHTWDIEVALDDTAEVWADAVDLLVDQLPATVARGGHEVDGLEPVVVVTTSPARTFLLTAGSPASLVPTDDAGPDPLTLPAEALVRLVYGRLDPAHTPAGLDDPRLPALRTAFPGF
ncbi:maleylpyruvate isomerase family mycothiol-dependent enzyme [Microlunatus antarcticus]|uniref:Uncharacterized protein (TIGR03083 family) n=1 Tax=Microlunatus antarcticus TaxID=53388 RepID=A0A7W5JWE8_9ACTN|nr:maleylpyruvate isomerase family mycothiol-dependent enzyme [Microlunatus antarcticus]MBB3327554.1 uncharacterized protein (TIGR03083 family) [Microlunatus antarcticus]